MQIMGAALNPEWRLIVGGQIAASGKINADIIRGHKLVINTDPVNMEIAEYTVEEVFVTDRYKDSDFNTARIFQLPAGKSTLVVLSDSTNIPSVFIEVKHHV